MLQLTRLVYGRILSLLENSMHGISKRIGEAAEQGDLKENADYHAAREKLGFTEAMVARFRADLAEVVPEARARETPCIGLHSLVELEGQASEAELIVVCQKLDAKMIGYLEDAGLLPEPSGYVCVTVHSPLGTELWGKVVSEETSRGRIRRIDMSFFPPEHSFNKPSDKFSQQVIDEIVFELGLQV